MHDDEERSEVPEEEPSATAAKTRDTVEKPAEEFGGRRKGLEPTRYGDWEMNGRCIDF